MDDEGRSSTARPLIAITVGEPAGIGPEIALEGARVASLDGAIRPVLIGDGRMLAARARAAGIVVALVGYVPGSEPPLGAVEVIDLPLAMPVVPGVLDAANGRQVLALLDRGIDGALSGEFDALVTAPVQKSVINDAGIPFTGHTEYLAERTGTPRVVMMLAGPMLSGTTMLRVALVTTHLALKEVPAAITRHGVLETLRILDHDLRKRFGIASPRILVTGLNPHAGEGGYLGREEIDTIAPAIAAAQEIGVDARGPYPADTLFQTRYLSDCDAVVAMYHDQGLPVLKFATFGRGVNVTLGLPIVRTSVDHGTALDLAAFPDPMSRIDAGSMQTAIAVAATMASASFGAVTSR
ncbi:MAG: 4-hydroxythreonine-4-phosphate dehydrogenase PdxA [Burkholderiaceae bacterium]